MYRDPSDLSGAGLRFCKNKFCSPNGSLPRGSRPLFAQIRRADREVPVAASKAGINRCALDDLGERLKRDCALCDGQPTFQLRPRSREDRLVIARRHLRFPPFWPEPFRSG